MTKLVFSYSHTDEALRNELEKHLAPLRRQGLIESWHDRRIIAGQDFNDEIMRHFDEADVVLLLISPDFIHSDYCYDIEMAQALKRHEAGEAIVIPVILRICHWHELPFGKLQAATTDGKPVTQFATLDEGFYQVVDAIKRAIKRLGTAQPRPAATDVVPARSAPGAKPASQQPAVRSSNLRLKQVFSDRDRDQAKQECIGYIGRYFSNSLDELKKRNAGVDTDFRQLDANRFEATVYSAGKQVSKCGIWLSTDRFGGDIRFSYDGAGHSSYNESLSVADDGYILGFKPLGMQFHMRQADTLLSFEGAAEYFWELLIQPLQR